MPLFFTADPHFGDHRTINIHRRPFVTATQMDEAIVASWNEVVGHDDEVWHLGDVARRPADVLGLLARLTVPSTSFSAIPTIPLPATPTAGRALITMPS